ncbi:MFS transporter [Bernardetia sp. OM2101]|uniref:MFS transporter n=1 Tax=Bernardetia sp. OM2101 TaxID=3344876 RepID=UPI0035D00998
MEKIKIQTHPRETFLYATSRMLERIAYYGIRAIIILYMVSESVKMDESEAFNIYSWLATSVLFSQIIGALLGDLLIGNRKSVIIGGVLQALGAFSFCIPSTIGLYIGLFLVVLGGGFYTPNIISNFGKLYLNKTKLLDSGFTLLYTAVNLGAFAGPLLIGYCGEYFGWSIGFIIAGILILVSLIPILFIKGNNQSKILASDLPIKRRFFTILIAFVFVGLFWAIYEISNFRIFDLQSKLSEISTLGIPTDMWSSLNTVFTVPFTLLAIILWSYFYSTQFFKLMIAFIFGTISFGILVLIPETPNEQHMILYLVSLFFISVAEIHIIPIIHSILTQYANPKYLAILISLAFIPTRLFSLIVGLFNEGLHERPVTALIIATVAMTILSIGLIIFNLINKKDDTVNLD